ncbi:MAG TPA: hypothetical protein VJW73_04395, partial [Gemmatimonadaceae bacterium]|nr:hypothetical protein [Gemmatimonadaceae bacterium]
RSILRMTHRAGVEWTAGHSGKYKAGIFPLFTCETALKLLALLLDAECGHRSGRQFDFAAAMHCLWVVVVKFVVKRMRERDIYYLALSFLVPARQFFW